MTVQKLYRPNDTLDPIWTSVEGDIPELVKQQYTPGSTRMRL
jgi:hypothetical protein